MVCPMVEYYTALKKKPDRQKQATEIGAYMHVYVICITYLEDV